MYVELTDPNHILRPTDEMTARGNFGTHRGPDHWLGCMTAEQLTRTGETVGRNSWARCRCRVEDKPVEWVVQDRVPVRLGIDRISWTFDDVEEAHSPLEGGLSQGKMHGTPHPSGSSLWLRVWCRPSDLPPKTRVRLWLVGNLVVSSPDSPCDTAVELHLDSEGFFHEG